MGLVETVCLPSGPFFSGGSMGLKNNRRTLMACLLLALSTGFGFDAAFATDVDFGPYMANMQRRIKAHWFPPRGKESKRVKVSFRLDGEGKATDVKVVDSSKDKPADEAAVLAVEKAAPFRSLPSGAPPTVDIEFTFDYNVFNRGKTTKENELLTRLRRGYEVKSQKEIIESLVALADYEVEKKQTSQAKDHYKQAIDLLHKRNPLSEEFLAEQLTALGDIYYEADDYESCQPLYKECLAIREKDPSNAGSLGEARRDMAYTLLYLDDDNADEAKVLFEKSLRDAQESSDDELALDVKQGIAHCYWKNSEHAKALPLYQFVLNQKKQKSPGEFADLGYRSKDVADCLYELHNYRESLPYFKDARQLLEKAGKNTEDNELTDARQKITEISQRLNVPVEAEPIAKLDDQKQKSIDKAYAWLPYAFGGSLLALLVIAISNSKNKTLDISGRKRS